jgi:folate-binding protein YgfZ
MRLELLIVQPSAVRATETCSLPTGTERRKIVKLAEDPAGAGVWPAAKPDHAISSSAARIKWAEGMPQHNTAIQADRSAAYDAARSGAGLVDRSDRGRIVLSGQDRASYLHGLLTNDIAALGAGEGCYAAYLTAQGRMITDLWVYELGGTMLVTMGRDVKDLVLSRFDQFVFSEDVQLGDATDQFAGTAIIGPDSARVVATTLEEAAESRLKALPLHGSLRAHFAGGIATVLRIADPGVGGFEVLVDAASGPALVDACRRAGAVDVDPVTAEAIRIEAGVPRFHRDMDESTIPLEVGLESTAISLTKGCYVGQEVIVRVLHRGHGRVARRLVGLVIEGELVPAAGAVVHAGSGQEAGRVTSSAWSPALRKPIAMALLHREFAEPGTTLRVENEAAVVTTLPFVSGA